MSSPMDLASVRFDKAAFGYRANDVDDYVQEVGKAITDLVNENRELEGKLEALAGKLVEYKEDEESLRSAVLGAQKLGDSIIRDSKNKAEVLLRDATIRSERMIDATHKKVELEQHALVQIHKEVTEFKNSLISKYKAHLELISSLPEQEKKPARDVAAEPVEEIAEEPVSTDTEQGEYVTPAPSRSEYFEPEAAADPIATQPKVVFKEEEFEQAQGAQPQGSMSTAQSEVAADDQTPYQRYASKYGTLLFGDDIEVH